jgi:hypothetical protein
MLVSVPGSEASSGGSFSIKREVVGGGGGANGGGNFSLKGSAGQAAAGTGTGGSFSLTGGFYSGSGGLVAVEPGPTVEAVSGVELYAPQPSPSAAGASIGFGLPKPGRVTLAVYGVNGAVIRMLASADYPAGKHAVAWDRADDSGRRVPPGIYWVHLVSNEVARTRKLVLL